MNWLNQLNEAINYIEDNLDGDIDYERVARIASCSSFHFQRMFSYMAGVPLAEYIRRRRMTKAAFDLQNGAAKVIDVALKYGYESPTAFNRAFQSVHGVSPSAAKNEGVSLKAYQPISFRITIKGETEVNYQIVSKEAFRIVGPKLSCHLSPENQEGFDVCTNFWAQQAQEGAIPKLANMMDNQNVPGILGVSVGDWKNAGEFDYYIAASSSKPVPEGMAEYEVPAATWAIFECKGAIPNSIQTMQKRIITEWFPNSGYSYADAPDIEQYTDGDESSDDYTCYIWVPVKK